jgi:hypothetical protein
VDAAKRSDYFSGFLGSTLPSFARRLVSNATVQLSRAQERWLICRKGGGAAVLTTEGR